MLGEIIEKRFCHSSAGAQGLVGLQVEEQTGKQSLQRGGSSVPAPGASLVCEKRWICPRCQELLSRFGEERKQGRSEGRKTNSFSNLTLVIVLFKE